jgi:pimeloyl-ACP methyl ester carboxylesterase
MLEGSGDSVRASVIGALLATPRVSFVAALEGVMASDPLPVLRSFNGPVLSIVSHLNAQPHSLHRIVPGLSHCLVPGASHWLMLDRPRRVNRLLDDFLAEVDARERPV